MEYRTDNPCARLGPVLGPQEAVVRHMPALPHREVAAVIERVRASPALPVVTRAFEFLVLTAARSGEVRDAQWAEIDPAAGVWTVPGARMKAKREHRVPLGRRAAQILETAQARRDDSGLVFPSPRGKLLTYLPFATLLQDLEVAAVPHGSQSSFRDWAAEETNHPREVVEAVG